MVALRRVRLGPRPCQRPAAPVPRKRERQPVGRRHSFRRRPIPALNARAASEALTE